MSVYDSITYVALLIEIQNDILKFIDIAFALLTIVVLLAVCILVAMTWIEILNQYQCQKRVTTVAKKGKIESKMIFVFLRDWLSKLCHIKATDLQANEQ